MKVFAEPRTQGQNIACFQSLSHPNAWSDKGAGTLVGLPIGKSPCQCRQCSEEKNWHFR